MYLSSKLNAIINLIMSSYVLLDYAFWYDFILIYLNHVFGQVLFH